ncbi:unnamed protein product [Mytilus coruscus]|uniref:Ig-like domain-containing protein n=1 Tax=Mytilus coruscus TaxID=42192 RepID=A0A6J8A6A6_MYTCO|nr:unnamed protein product [Mytilus coruscus]
MIEYFIYSVFMCFLKPLIQGESKDSCDCKYWICIGIILAVVSTFSLVCTVMLIWKRKQIQLKAKFIICCCGTSVLLLVAVLIILTITTLVIWLIAMLIVIFTCCASEECNVEGKVAGISFVLSLVVILVFQVLFWVICRCIDRGYIVYTIACGDKKTLLADFTQPDGKIESIEWTYQGSIVSFENAAGGTIECPALTLTMVSLDQSGVYVCIISCNSGEKMEQKVFHFKLLVTPKQYEVKIGDSVKLLEFLEYCQQVKRVDWTHSNNTITTNSCFYKGGDKANPVLTVNCFATSDSGLYYCRVRAGQSEFTKWFSARLKIKEQQEVNLGERIVLLNRLGRSADVRSVVWTHDKRLLVSESFCSYEGGTIECPALTIPVVSPKNAGKYECKLQLNQGELRMYRVILEVKGR